MYKKREGFLYYMLHTSDNHVEVSSYSSLLDTRKCPQFILEIRSRSNATPHTHINTERPILSNTDYSIFKSIDMHFATALYQELR